ncbi:MAG: RDD family protein [Opitutus sp.]|nr:RDD family protein [Opitutus sp.]
MFTIIGGDGKEYGPVTAEQIRAWINAGRANLATAAKALGTEEWRRVGDYAEFSSPDGAPPVMAAVAPVTDETLGHRGLRLLAALLDGFLESLCWLPTSQAVVRALGAALSSGRLTPQELVEAFTGAIGKSIPYLLGLMVLQAALLTFRGQTVGKIATGLRVVRVADGSPAGFLHGFLLRGFLPRCLRHLPLIGVLFWFVDNCFIFRDDKRCLHDLIGGTKVVKA